jgi:DNA-binding transcriptional MocR family regulator
MENPRASALLQLILARMGPHNALVASQVTLAELTGCSLSTIQRAVRVLRNGWWIEVKQIGPTGTACAYIVNDEVVWSGPREGKRYALFSASVIVAEAEQPKTALSEEPLIQLPAMYPGERQLPTGDGLPPPSQPALPGMEPDLPTKPMVF